MEAAEPDISVIQRIMAPMRIWSIPLIHGCSPYTSDIQDAVISELHCLQINRSLNNISYLILVTLGCVECLVIELQLQAVRALELHPVLLGFRVILPRPIKVSWCFNCLF